MTGMTGRGVARLVVAGALVTCAVGLTACREVELTSGWATGEIAVDGVDDEWVGATTYFEKQDVTVGLLNDEEFLYVSLVTSGPVGRLAMATGLMVWFDPDGGTDEWYGIRFPVPPESGERPRGVVGAAVVPGAGVVAVAAEPAVIGVGHHPSRGCARSNWSAPESWVDAACRCRSAVGSMWRSATPARRSSTSSRLPWHETMTIGWGSGWSRGQRSESGS